MPVLDTKAIVIRNQILGEADKIITFYTLKYGKVRAVAKGARKTKSRYSGCLETLSYGDLVFFYRPNRDLHSLNSFDISEAFFELRDDLTKIAYGSYLAELVDKIAQENQPDVQIFELLYLTLLAMKGIKEPELLSRAFEIRLLSLSGFEPQLENCIKCAEELVALGPIRVGFSCKFGGAMCHKCIHKDPEALIIWRGTLELMKSLKKLPLELVLRLRATEQIKQELKSTLNNFTIYHIGQRLRSVKFIETLENLETLETLTDTDSGSKGSKILEI